MDNQELLNNVVALVFMGGVLVVAYGVLAFICYRLADALKALPPEHQRMSPGLVWLLMIPCWGLIWNFFVFIQIPSSYDSYMRSVGRPMDGSLMGIGIAFAVVSLLCAIPYAGGCFGIIGIVLLIVFMVKLGGLAQTARELGPPVESHPRY